MVPSQDPFRKYPGAQPFLHLEHSVGEVRVHSLETYSPAAHVAAQPTHSWSERVAPVHGLAVYDSYPDGLGVHFSQRVVSTGDSPEQGGPAMYSPGWQEMRQLAHCRSNCVAPVQKPTMYSPAGGLATCDWHRPLHCAHKLSAPVPEPTNVQSLLMYWPFLPEEKFAASQLELHFVQLLSSSPLVPLEHSLTTNEPTGHCCCASEPLADPYLQLEQVRES